MQTERKPAKTTSNSDQYVTDKAKRKSENNFTLWLTASDRAAQSDSVALPRDYYILNCLVGHRNQMSALA